MITSHPAADIFPLMTGESFDALVRDIREKGLLTSIVLFDGMVLDGRNRLRACAEAGVEPRFMTYDGNDPIGFVVSHNLTRRHLDESQRAMVAGRIANMKQGARSDLSSIEGRSVGVSQPEAARRLNVGRASVERAQVVLTKGAPEVVQAVDAGGLSVSAAAFLAKMPAEKQREILDRSGGNGRKVRALVREEGGHAPIYGSRWPEQTKAPATEEPRRRGGPPLVTEHDETIARMTREGASGRAIANEIGRSQGFVANAQYRLNLRRKAHPIDGIERRAREGAEDFESFTLHPEMYRDGSTAEQRENCIKQLRAMVRAAKGLINWLNDDAIGG